MLRPNLLLPLCALAVVLLFAGALVHLLLLRYEKGDVYPAYSTLRSDPLGTRAFYDSLQATGRYKVARGFSTLRREVAQKSNAIVYLGISSEEIDSFTRDEISALDAYVKNGGRVIITFAPQEPLEGTDTESRKTTTEESTEKTVTPLEKPAADDAEPQTRQEKYERDQLQKEKSADDKENNKKDDTPPEYHPSLAAVWGFGWDRHREGGKSEKTVSGRDSDHPDALPEVFAIRSEFGNTEPNVPWKSALYFVRLEPDWIVLYYAKFKPVLIRRHWGDGEILLASDSYFVSNEALKHDRRPRLLSLLAGWPGQLLFDEAHLGTQQEEGIMSLAHKFRLEGYLYGMLAVLALVLWRNSLPLVPASNTAAPTGGTVSGKDSRSGLVNLLRRNIPPSEILKTCLAEWRRGVTPGRRHLHDRLSEMDSIVNETSHRPEEIVQSYHRLRQINAPGKFKETYATKS